MGEIRSELIALLPKSMPNKITKQIKIYPRGITIPEQKRTWYKKKEKITDEEILEILYDCCRPEGGKSHKGSKKWKINRESSEVFKSGAFWIDLSFDDLSHAVPNIIIARYGDKCMRKKLRSNQYIIDWGLWRIHEISVKC